MGMGLESQSMWCSGRLCASSAAGGPFKVVHHLSPHRFAAQLHSACLAMLHVTGALLLKKSGGKITRSEAALHYDAWQ